MIEWNWVEFIGVGANAVTAVAVASGVWIAQRQLGNWRVEAQTKRRAEVAEELLTANSNADSALRFIRSPWGSLPPEDDSDKKSYQWRERLARMEQRSEDFDRLRQAQVRAKAYLGDETLDRAVQEFFDVRQELWAALGTLAAGSEADGDQELKKFYIGLRWKAFGTYSDRDELGKRQQNAKTTIEDRLYPVIRLEAARGRK